MGKVSQTWTLDGPCLCVPPIDGDFPSHLAGNYPFTVSMRGFSGSMGPFYSHCACSHTVLPQLSNTTRCAMVSCLCMLLRSQQVGGVSAINVTVRIADTWGRLGLIFGLFWCICFKLCSCSCPEKPSPAGGIAQGPSIFALGRHQHMFCIQYSLLSAYHKRQL